jgi:hypothetical protein
MQEVDPGRGLKTSEGLGSNREANAEYLSNRLSGWFNSPIKSFIMLVNAVRGMKALPLFGLTNPTL